MAKKFLGQPIVSEHTLNAAFNNYNGRNYICTTVSGAPPKLNIYNLDEDKVEASFDLYGALNSWNHKINADGNLYVVACGQFYRYDFSLNEFKDYGKINGSTECFVMDNDEDGNIYMGSCPNGNIYKYDIKEDKIYDLGNITPEAVYVRSLSYHNGYLYCGVKGEDFLEFYKINSNNPNEKKVIPVPSDFEYYPNGLDWIYTSTAVGNKIIIHCKADKICPLLIYDTDKEEFVSTGYKGNFPGLFVSPKKDGKSYFACDGNLMEIDIISGKVKQSDFPKIRSKQSVSIDFIKDVSGKENILAILDNKNASVELINLKTRTSFTKKLNLDKATYYIQTMESGDFKNGDNAVYLSAYCGDNAVRYDVEKKEYKNIRIGQCEGMIGYRGKQYMGVYPHNELYIYDNNTNMDIPEKKGTMSYGQDRPFAMCAGDGYIFMGTIPDYGKRGGDIVIYDVTSGKNKIIKMPVKEQSIIGLQYNRGLIYGSTSAWGGLGAKPCTDDAKIFIYDIEKNCVTESFTPDIPGITNPTWIGSIKLDGNGNLWGVTGNTLFLLDLKTKKVIKHITFGDYTYSKIRHRWRPTYIRYDSKGNLFVNILGIHKVDTKTMEYTRVTKETDDVFLFTLDKEDNIYYAVDNNFYTIERKGMV